MTAAIAALAFAACSQDDEVGNAATAQPAVLTLGGGDDYIDLTTDAEADWQIVECPEWITPVNDSGTAADAIRLYVESNRRHPLRTGNISVRYANGETLTTRAEQDNTQPKADLRRSYATGWGFDIRTYNDSRGLRDQIFNIERILKNQKNAFVRSEPSTSNHIEFYYGDDASDLMNDMKGSLSIDGKFKVFSLDLQASFGSTAINNSKRIFSWIRDKSPEYVTYFNNVDFAAAQKKGWFTTDFAALRDSIIKSDGSDETISQLIDNYGTHFVTRAELGGCCDYYYSSVYDNSEKNLNVQATLTFAYQSKFKLNASADYSNDLKDMSQETIENFSVKGGNSVELTTKVYAGTVTSKDMEEWKLSIRDNGKLELLNFDKSPITLLFPRNIAKKITNYTDRLYYSDIPVTRTAE